MIVVIVVVVVVVVVVAVVVVVVVVAEVDIESPSNQQKMAQDPSFLTLLTSKFASRHTGVHFFDIATSKSALKPDVF